MRLFPAFALATIFVGICSLLRVALALRPEASQLGGGEILASFAIGTGFDLIAALYAIAPLVLWLALAPDRLARTGFFRVLTLAAFAAGTFGVLFLAVAEWLFWQEFGARFNFIAVDYLIYTHEVLGNIWQSYPTGRLLLALALAALVLTVLLARRLWSSSGAPLARKPALLIVAALGAGIAGTVYFVDSDQQNFSRSDTANELAGSGLYDFFAALRRNELDYERNYATLPLGSALDIVRRAFPRAAWIRPEAGGVERLEHAHGAERRLNVVLVSVESLGAEFLGAYGDKRGLTPNLDRLARESLWFANAYATGNRTVRGLEALSLALPPTPGQSIVHRPHNEKLFSLGSVFEDKGYAVLFAYGGYGYFDNMNAFFDANDYRTIDRRSIPSARIEFENIWGVADEHLYDQVIDEIDHEKAGRPDQPVFVHVMTTSNHRPYTYPRGRIDIPSGSGRPGAVKYTDYAIGRFIERARSRPWFADTLFVITADHGANARGTMQIPVDKYLIPIFVYSPANVAPRRVDRLMSQIDVAPTLLGLLDFEYYNKFLGRDVLHSPPSSDRAFVANYQTLGYLKPGHMVVLQPKRRIDLLPFAGSAPGPVNEVALVREAIAFYQVASHLFRDGLYRDEEQLRPEQRVAAVTTRRR